jgi:Stress responsive A/B Barrel Domain
MEDERKRGGIMQIPGTRAARSFAAVVLALALFGGGYVAGQARFAQPKTIIHVVEIKWLPGVTDDQKARVLEGVKEVAARVPGVKNVWLKADRLEPRDFNAAFAIEFRDRAAADAYAESSLHDAWDKQYIPLRANSVSIQVTNP